MGDSGSSRDYTAELGDELLHVPSLWDFFTEKTIIDAKKWHASRVSSPPWWILIGLVAATIFFGFLKSMLAILSGVFAVALMIWIIFLRTGSTQSGVDSLISDINTGTFPTELKDSISKRLRWWSVLLVPAEWTPQSKIFTVRDKLNQRVGALESEIVYWKSPEGHAALSHIRESEEAAKIRQEEYQKKLQLLKSRGVNVNEALSNPEIAETKVLTERYTDPQVLIKLLRSKGDCDRQLERICTITDPIERANQELVLVQALLIHCNKIIELIEEAEKLKVSVETIKSDNLNDKIKEILSVLEKRRAVVGRLNRISPKRVMGIVNYNAAKAQSEISMERFIDG